MIARIWQGITLTIKADQYLEYLNHYVIPAYRKAMGNAGVQVLNGIVLTIVMSGVATLIALAVEWMV